MSKSSGLKKVIFPLGILAFIFVFGFITWALSGHGTFGLMRVTPLFLYVLIVILALGLIFTGLYLWYWWFYLKGREKRGLFTSILVLSVIYIALFAAAFVQTGIFPPSKSISPVTQLPVSSLDGNNLHFAVGSDAHFGAGTNSPDKTAAMLAQISDPANKYDLFVSLGDLVNHGFENSQWGEAAKALDPAAAKVAMRFVPGNHDTMFGGLKRYSYYAGPETGPKLWQRIDSGKVHFLLLDVEWSAETVTKAQLDWLEAQLKSIPTDDWKIVMSHGFYYASGITLSGWHWYDNPETISKLTPLFEKYGVDIVFSGHNHYMEFLQHAGVSYVICGAFGGPPDPAPTYISPSSVWQTTGQTGFMDVTLNGNEATVIFRNYDSSVLKSFTVEKH